MMYRVGESAYLLKFILSNSCGISFLSGVIVLTIIIRLSVGFFTSPMYPLFYIYFVFNGGAKYDYIFKNIFLFKFK